MNYKVVQDEISRLPDFLKDPNIDPQRIALQLFQESGVDGPPNFVRESTLIEDILSKIVEENAEMFSYAIGTFSEIVTTMQSIQQTTLSLRRDLTQAEQSFEIQTNDLEPGRIMSLESRELLKILEKVRWLRDVPNRVKTYIKSKHFLHAAHLVVDTIRMIFERGEDELWEIKAISEISNSVIHLKTVLPDLIIREIQSTIYSSALSEPEDWITTEDISIPPSSLPSIEYLLILVEALGVLSHVPSAIQSIRGQIQPKFSHVFAEVRESLDNTLSGSKLFQEFVGKVIKRFANLINNYNILVHLLQFERNLNYPNFFRLREVPDRISTTPLSAKRRSGQIIEVENVKQDVIMSLLDRYIFGESGSNKEADDSLFVLSFPELESSRSTGPDFIVPPSTYNVAPVYEMIYKSYRGEQIQEYLDSVALPEYFKVLELDIQTLLQKAISVDSTRLIGKRYTSSVEQVSSIVALLSRQAAFVPSRGTTFHNLLQEMLIEYLVSSKKQYRRVVHGSISYKMTEADFQKLRVEFANEESLEKRFLGQLNENNILKSSLLIYLSQCSESYEWLSQQILKSGIQGGRSINISIEMLSSKFKTLSERILLNLRKEIRCRSMYHLSLMKKEKYYLLEEPLKPDVFVEIFNEDFSKTEEFLAFLELEKRQYLFYNLPKLVCNKLITNAVDINRVNRNGVLQMVRNVFAIQQNFTRIVSDISEFERVRHFYGLFSLFEERGIEGLCAFAQAHPEMFQKQDYLIITTGRISLPEFERCWSEI